MYLFQHILDVFLKKGQYEYCTKILLIYVAILLFLLGGCTAQDKSNNPSAKKSTIIYNDISNFESFEKYFVLKEREISETEINNVIKAISAD